MCKLGCSLPLNTYALAVDPFRCTNIATTNATRLGTARHSGARRAPAVDGAERVSGQAVIVFVWLAIYRGSFMSPKLALMFCISMRG